MFKKRRQRSKKYTLTSFGSVDEDRCQDSQEEDGVLPGSESEFDDDGFSAVPDPTWDSGYLDMLEKRATAGTEGRGDGAEDAPSPGLSATTGKGAQLFEQQRKRAAEHAKKMEVQPHVPPPSHIQEHTHVHQVYPEIQPQLQSNLHPQQKMPAGPTFTEQELSQAQGPISVDTYGVSSGDPSYTTIGTAMATSPATAKLATASVPTLASPTPTAETPFPELPASNVLNRTARPFTPGFISIRAATAPVTFRPPVTKTSQRPASAAVVPPPFSTGSEIALNAALVTSQLPSGLPSMISTPPIGSQAPLTQIPEAPVKFYPPAISTSVETMRSVLPLTTVNQIPVTTAPPMSMPSPPPVVPARMAPISVPSITQIPDSAGPVAPVPIAQPLSPQFFMQPVSEVSVLSQTNAVPTASIPGPTGRTGILLEARRRSGKLKPMFNVPDVKKKSPNPELLSMVQNLDDRSTRDKHGQLSAEAFYDAMEEEQSDEASMGKVPPPVAPKPRVIHETPQVLQAGGKGAELFARRQSRMGMYVVDSPPDSHFQQEVAPQSATQPFGSSHNPSLPSQWKYSPNVRAPPPIGYNPLLGPSIPVGPQRDKSKPDSYSRGGSQREGIKALDFMRKQPYQLNPAMFNYGGSVANLSAMPSYQAQRQQGDYTPAMVGSSLTTPKQIPIKTASVYEIKRFSTPTPMSAPTLAPKVIAPRSATTLGERLSHSGMTSPPPVPCISNPVPLVTTPPVSLPITTSPRSQPAGLPSLPKFSATPIPNPVLHAVPTPYSPVSYATGLQAAKQFQSAPELSILASLPPLKSNSVQAPKPRFVATKGGVQPRVWRPGAI